MKKSNKVIETYNTGELTGWVAKIYSDGLQKYGFMETAFSKHAAADYVVSELKLYNPDHDIVLV